LEDLKEEKKYFENREKEVEFVNDMTYSLTDTAFISKKQTKRKEKNPNIVQKIELNLPTHITKTLDAITNQL